MAHQARRPSLPCFLPTLTRLDLSGLSVFQETEVGPYELSYEGELPYIRDAVPGRNSPPPAPNPNPPKGEAGHERKGGPTRAYLEL
ncbi:hypothetical protein EYF80_062381 [Liparis tanakae]|uniref:Uncharacterized protein n=1 Tax=Liparis tanakae TaxID=230148 RepID=A0A4Z2EG74_9TELE|nr:hypothetical protein EYF80_062381 [Liparis tanakae]